jgi:hypothetical protein
MDGTGAGGAQVGGQDRVEDVDGDFAVNGAGARRSLAACFVRRLVGSFGDKEKSRLCLREHG